jgi:hypothetical protein
MRTTWLVQLAFVAAAAGSTAFASPIDWTIDATLDDGATITGSFVLDPDLGPFQTITNFNIDVSAATIPFLTEPLDGGLPTSIFPAYDFTPSNSTAEGPFLSADGSFSFTSDSFAYGGENLVLQFVPSSPLTDTSSTLINNSDINVNDGHSAECFDCDPYVCFAGATSSICVNATASTPEPGSLPLLVFGVFALSWAIVVKKRRGRIVGTHLSPVAQGNRISPSRS